MNSKAILLLQSYGSAFIRLIVGSLAFLVAAPAALAAPPDLILPPVYGLSSVASTETFRLVLYNAATDMGQPSCAVQVNLLSDSGASLGSVTSSLPPGQSVVLDQSAFSPPAPTPSDSAPPMHVSLRPQIAFLTVPPDPCRHILPTFEIVNAATGETALVARAYYPPDPCLVSCVFGFLDTTSDVVVRLSVVNTAPGAPAGACALTVGFTDVAGVVLQTQTATLAAGQSVVLDQMGGALLRPWVSVAPEPVYPPNPCLALVGTVEVVDAASDQTQFFVPPVLVIPPSMGVTTAAAGG